MAAPAAGSSMRTIYRPGSYGCPHAACSNEGPQGPRWSIWGEFDGVVELAATSASAALQLLARLMPPPAGGAVRHAAPSVAESELHRAARRVSYQYPTSEVADA